jgi:RNA polymerase sigma factor (sigma-70 family)
VACCSRPYASSAVVLIPTSLASRERIRLPGQYLLVDGGRATFAIAAPEDFEAAFREHFAPVHRFIARRVGKALAEDLSAEVFATAYRRRTAYRPERGSLRSWLYGIAANVVRGYWRDEQQLLELDARVAQGVLGPLAGAQFADAADDRVVAATVAPRIAGALAALSSEQREVLVLHAWADLSHEEIAAALGIAQGTARSRLSRARAALRAQLGEFDFDQWTFKEHDHA